MPEKVGKTENNMSSTSQIKDIKNPNGNIAKRTNKKMVSQ